MIRAAAGWLIFLLHALFVAFLTWAPFSSCDVAIVGCALLMPCLWVHWLLNDDTCALTLLERKLRGVENCDSFFYNLVSPIYKPRDADVRAFAWVASVLLWGVAASKVLADPSMVRRAFTKKR